MNCRKFLGIFTALSLCTGAFSYSGHAADAALTHPGEVHGGYVQLYTPAQQQERYVSPEMPLTRASSLPEAFDLREEGYVTPVRDQGAEGMCFAFAAVGACETNLLMQGLESNPETLDLSEAHMGYFLYTQQESPLDPMYGDYIDTAGKGADGGNGIFASAALASGIGTQQELFCSYEDWDSGYSAYQRYSGPYRLHTMETITLVATSSERDVIKGWLMESGGVSVAFSSSYSFYYDNGTSYAYYTQDRSFYEDANHAALIVGWDDSYSRENFPEDRRPDHDGAWLVKNSYGVDLLDDGYFWMSYEEPSAGSYCRYELIPVSEYDDVYEYDGAGYVTAYNYDAAANIFLAENDCLLTETAFYVPAGNGNNVSYEIDVYTLEENTSDPTDGKRVSTISGRVQYGGYFTVPLEEEIELSEGQQFSLVLRLKTSSGSGGYLPIEEDSAINSTFHLQYNARPGESYVLQGRQWTDTSALSGDFGDFGNIPLKALTLRRNSSSSVRLDTVISLTEETDHAETDPIVQAAFQQARDIQSSDTSAAVMEGAAVTLLGALETQTGLVSYPDYFYLNLGARPGDSNGDGKILISDATAALTIYARRGASMTERLRLAESYAMDMDTDGTIEISDATEILRYYAYYGAFGVYPDA
ncbi:MAG: hypothetical protein IJ496_02275 [Ruminococcus sp.]|nr:hypothetical protein [Ruminococcus sp.]